MSALEPKDLSIVIPLYNEEENVNPLFLELVPALRTIGRSFEILAVNDGSKDGTLDALRALMPSLPELRVLSLAKNSGQTAAFEAGFRAAEGRYIVTMDGDLQIDPKDLGPMLSQLEADGVDFVYGWRRDRKDPFTKRVSTKVANWVRDRLTGEDIPDTGCPLKIFKREILSRMKLFDGMHRFFITLAHIDGYRSSMRVVNHRPRQHGVSKYGVWNRIFKALRDTFAVRWMKKRHLRYAVNELSSAREAKARSAEAAG